MENVSHHQAVCAFKEGVWYWELNLKFGWTGDMSLTRMMEIATRYANGEEEDRLRSGKSKPVGQDTGGGNSDRKQNLRVLERLQSQPKENLKENLKGPGPLRR